ncbi:MAG: cupin domain-containing protein [Oscillospiraceae bacterium]|nr:cupin domain-containing protein [Oscillospiraceae bacterium]MBQ3242065.1 cupin domain-containing protein [Oscillospiraceae bacterium]MBQ7083415.1 cupin domain-containing protein [Oscillospiraceae bacterium]MBR2635759.1 cupin domain-containing protein [Oscillospiraceae bacterium]
MENKLMEIAFRIRELRDILEFTPEEMAEATATSVEEYLEYESGSKDFSFTFLYQCAKKFGVDMVELVTGENPRLSFYSIVRKDEGLPIKRRAGFNYQHLAYLFKNKTCEPFLVTAPYQEEVQNEPIHLSYHKGQEFDYVIEGELKIQLEDHTEILHAGDAIYYNSGHGHGMIATGGKECKFIAVVLKEEEE